MDRYDAILEHLKKAQSDGLESMATRLDAIADSLDELIQSAKSAIDGARPTEDDEVLAVAEIEEKVAELRSEEQARLEEIARLEEQAQATPAGISLENLRTLDAARSQSELLRALLPMLSEHVGRAVVLVIREGVISAWSGIGFEDGEMLRDWHGGVAASPAFQQLVETSSPLLIAPGDDPLLSQWLENEVTPDDAALLPISLRGKLMGIVYIDHQGNQPWDVETAQSLNAIGCWLIDTLHHRSTVPTPTLAGIGESEGEETSIEADVPQTEPEIEEFEPPPEEELEDREEAEAEVDETPAPESFEAPEVEEPEEVEAEVEETPAPESFEAPEVEEPESWDSEGEEPDTIEYEEVSEEEFSQPDEADEASPVDYDFEPEAEAEEEEFDPSATVRIDREEVEANASEAPAPEEVPPPAEVPPPEPPAEEKDRPSVVEMEAPPPVRPVEPPPEPEPDAAEAPDEDARQEEARRFARLLVSEIKLYNEDEVERGRVEKDIARRLREDIDRSREMYEKRIPADVRESHDYFFDELVRILADGDADALGM
jgi:hypothetical protein